MQELYATLLLHEAKLPITIENLMKIFQSVGLTPDEGKLKALVASLEGQNIDELIKQATITTAPTTAPAEKKEEEKEEEEKRAESAASGLSALFG